MGFFGGLFGSNVEKMERKRDVQGLIRALNHKDKEVKIKAIQALGRLKDVTAKTPLYRSFGSQDRDISWEAWNALKTIGKPTSKTLTLALRRYKRKEIYNEAWEILKTMKKPPVEPIVQAWKDEAFRHEAEEILKTIGKPAVKPLLQLMKEDQGRHKSKAQYLLLDLGDAAIKPLMRVIENDNYLRRDAAWTLGMIENRMRGLKTNKTDEIIDFLLEALKNRNYRIRTVAAAGIRSSGVVEPKTIQPLIQALSDKSIDVRKEVAYTLGSLRVEEAVEPLIQALKDAEPSFQYSIKNALEFFGTDKALTALGKKRRLDMSSIGDMIRKGDVKGLSEGFQRAGDWDNREWAVVGLERMLIDKVEYDKAEMIKALNDIIQVCEAEIGGGTYRTNCIEVAKRSLRKITN
jgi:HEAT repeat protein